VPDRRLVEKLAEDLGTSPGLIEKDWHVVRALGVIAQVDTAGMTPVFSGGTSLSKGWELIKRFSEDIDFKVGEPAASSASRARRERTAYRERVLEVLAANDFEIIGKPDAGNASRFFCADVAYGAQFGSGQGLAAAYPHRDVVPRAGAGAGRAPDPLADRCGATPAALDRIISMRRPG
jgi:nucleotidyltransferase AbiEii toxin of type IV toxin-antitoxin system